MTRALPQPAGIVRPADRRGEIAWRVLAEWRRLTGGSRVRDAQRRTLVACSGGADSSALAIVLAGVMPGPVLAHVVHDLRPRGEALADRDAARDLAGRLGLEFVEAAVAVRDGAGNAEARARRARYAALDALASDCGTLYIATAHHGDDQLETVLMRLLRGAGPRGLAGIQERRPLGHAMLVRPMLGIERSDTLEVCRTAGWAWREDATNGDAGRARAALRRSVTPELRRLWPGAGARVTRSVRLLRDAAVLVEDRAAEVALRGRAGAGVWRWERAGLAAEPATVLGEVLRSIATPGEGRGRGRIVQAVRAIREGVDGERVFELGGCTVRVTGARVEAIARSGDDR